jgi:hypothetical protein
MQPPIDISEIPRLRAVLESCKAKRQALEGFKNASTTHRRAKALTPGLDRMLAELQALRSDEAATKRKAANGATKAAASTADKLLHAALTASPEAASRINARAADFKDGAATRRELREAYKAGSPRQKSLIWNTFRRALTAFNDK